MTDPVQPEWVRKRDGRLEPFDAAKISRALFATTEELGRPDAFLARELADGVTHFLTADGDGDTRTTRQVEEMVVKVVTQLRHPALAEAFARHAQARVRGQARNAEQAATAGAPEELVLRFERGAAPADVLAACGRAYALRTVFARDLAAAHEAGLLALTGLAAPAHLAGCVLAPPAPGDNLAGAAADARRFVGDFAVLDSPEYLPAADDPGALAAALKRGLGRTGLRAVVNLNAAAGPSWAEELAEGPLFARPRRHTPERLAERADGLIDELLRPGPDEGLLRIDWHLGERDFQPAVRERLLRVCRRALDGAAIGFAFDRPRRPAALAEGVERQRPAVLMCVGLNLPALAAPPGVAADPALFLRRLGTLARLALSAAVQKRDFLRRQERGRHAPAVTSGFLLDRARLVVAPLGLDRVAEQFTGHGLTAGAAALDFGRRVVQRLVEVLGSDGRSAQLDACVDGPFGHRLEGRTDAVAGLTPSDGPAPVKAQLRAAGALHAAASHGTLALRPPEERVEAEQLAGWLREAWQQTEVVRLRLLRPERTQRELEF
jgi:hypothetical protein